VPKFVKVKLDANEQAAGAPEIAQAANDESTCAGCAKPGGLKVADKILAIQDKMEATPPLPKKKTRWFDEEIEEEEEEDDAE
jgi:hypothetical protein